MPCHDGGPSHYDQRNNEYVLRAMLYGIIGVIEKGMMLKNVLDAVDWTGIGVTRNEFDQWWLERQDAERLRREAEIRRRDDLRQSARDKLTVEERRALGL